MKNLLLLGCLLIGMATTMSFTAPIPADFDESTTVSARAKGSVEWNISGGGLGNVIVNGRILVSGVSGTGSIAFNNIEDIVVSVDACPGYIVIQSNVSQEGNTFKVTATVIEAKG